MITIIENKTRLSKYLFDDDVVVQVNDSNIVVGDPVEFIIADLNATNSSLVDVQDAPDDWFGNKYFFDFNRGAGDQWVQVPGWVSPEELYAGDDE